MANIEAIIFDWAGTTVDYGSFAPVRAFQEVFRQYGLEPTMEETRHAHGHAENRSHPYHAEHAAPGRGMEAASMDACLPNGCGRPCMISLRPN